MNRRINRQSSSFALLNAVSNLFHFEDFDCELMASGGFADIFKAVHVPSGVIMVIKKPKKNVHQPIMTKEAEIMMKLKHTNVLRACGVIIDNGMLSIVSDYINGGSLQNFVKDEGNILPWSTRIKLAVDIANGMSYINKMGYLHRDLTSLNVLIRIELDYISAVVSDFGLTAKIPRKGTALTSVGTPFCRAPESIRGEYYDHKADVFSFGIILCELLLRCDYDPDNLPRTQNYGVDYIRIGEMVEDCPVSFLALAFLCCHMDPERRPAFEAIGFRLESTLIDYLSCGLEEEKDYDDYAVNKRWASLDDLAPVEGNDSDQVEELDLPSVADTCTQENMLFTNFIKNLSPRDVGEAMARLDPHYTSNGLDLSALFNLTAPVTSEKSGPLKSSLDSPYTEPDSGETLVEDVESSVKPVYRVNSLPLTRKGLKMLADRCLCKLPSDRNMKKQSDSIRGHTRDTKRNISRTLIHNMPNHGITLPMPIVNGNFSQSDKDSAFSSITHKRKIFVGKSTSITQNCFKYSRKTMEIGDNLLRKFFNRSSSSFNSSELLEDETHPSNDGFCRFMRRYLVACLRTQHPIPSNGRNILFTPESLKRLNEARELFRRISKT